MGTQTVVVACPLCGIAPLYQQRIPDRDALGVECERCGRFSITRQALGLLTPEQKPLLSAYCRRLPEKSEAPRITTTSIEQFIQTLPKYTPLEKLDNLLELMGRMSSGLGEYTSFNVNRDYPLLIARDPREIEFLLAELRSQFYLGGTNDGTFLTMTGWWRLEEIKKTGRLSNRVFVAMWFDESMNELYEKAIDPAIREAGYDPIRIDRHEHVNRIDDEIIAQIRRSRFMVADFTGQRYGVYFEAGMMQGLGRTVIWLCGKKELDEGNLHFDVRQFNFIAYESVEDAKTRLYNRILAIEGEGPGQFPKPE
jgi:hypothetical protein